MLCKRFIGSGQHLIDNIRITQAALDSLCSLGFLVKTNGTYQTESSAAPLLSTDTPTSVRPMVLLMGSVWRNWSKLNDIVLGKAMPNLKNGILDKENFQAFLDAAPALRQHVYICGCFLTGDIFRLIVPCRPIIPGVFYNLNNQGCFR